MKHNPCLSTPTIPPDPVWHIADTTNFRTGFIRTDAKSDRVCLHIRGRFFGGRKRTRTADLLRVKQAL